MLRMRVGCFALCALVFLACSHESSIQGAESALVGEAHLVVGGVRGVGDQWVTVTLDRSYASMIVVATPVYEVGSPPLVTRIRSASADRFDVKVDRFDGQSGAATPVAVQYIVVEEGVFSQDGLLFEAVKYDSATTAGRNHWAGDARGYQQPYSSPVVLGQVMSYNDARPSTFWSFGSKRGRPPSSTVLNVGKHIAEDTDTDRALETIGYVVFEAGSYVNNGVSIEAATGSDSIKGVDDGTYSYAIADPGPANVVVLSAAGMDGNNGGWPVLIGPDATGGSAIQLAFDEDQVKDNERRHTTEQVAYVAVNPCPTGSAGQTCGAASFCTRDGHCESCAPGASGEGVVDTPAYAIRSQADLETLAGSWCVTGNLRVSTAELTDLTGIESLTVVGGDLKIWYSQSLVSVDGLSGLRHIGGDVFLRESPSLERIDALGDAETSGTLIQIWNNPALESIAGLPVPSEWDGDVMIFGNPSIRDLEGFSALVHAGRIVAVDIPLVADLSGLRNLKTATELWLGDSSATDLSALSRVDSLGLLRVESMPLLDLQGLDSATIGGVSIALMPNLVSLEGVHQVAPTFSRLSVSGNPLLTDFSGLEGVQAVDGFFIVRDNPALTSFAGLEQLHSVVDMDIENNDQVADMSGLEALQTVGGYVQIERNAALSSLNGLQALQSVGEDISIVANRLSGMNGLGGLTSVGEDFIVNSEDSLTTMDGLTSLVSVGGLFGAVHSDILTDPGEYPALQTVGSFFFSENHGLPHCRVTALVALHNATCSYCGGNNLTSPECTPTMEEMQGLGTGEHRDYSGAQTFSEFVENPVNPQIAVRRDSNNNTLEMSRATLEFELRSIPKGAAIMSATLELPTQAVAWGVGNTLGLYIFGYRGDGMVTSADGVAGDMPSSVLFMNVDEVQTTVDVRWLLQDARAQGYDYLGLNLRLESEWGTGSINQMVKIYNFDNPYEWNRPKLTVEWQ